jgi:hypothetical protein
MAESVAIYRQVRTLARPPQIARLPRSCPLSQLKGATPTNAAIFLRLRVPNSGNSAMRVTARTRPTPGTERNKSSFSRQTGLSRKRDWISWSMSFNLFSSQSMCSWTPGCNCLWVRESRFFSATSISSSCRRRTSQAWSWRTCSSGKHRGSGWTASAKRASIRASIWSVLASRPKDLAKSRAWRGLMTATAKPALAKAATAGVSYPPVASSTISVGCNSTSFWTRRAMPGSSLSTCQWTPAGRSAMSRCALLTSMPTKEGVEDAVVMVPRQNQVRSQPCLIRARSPGNCSGYFRQDTATHATTRSADPGALDLPCPDPTNQILLYLYHTRGTQLCALICQTW